MLPRMSPARLADAAERIEQLYVDRAKAHAKHNKENLRSSQAIYTDGSLIACGGLSRWQWDSVARSRGARAKCDGFSRRARRNMLLTVAKVPANLLPLLGTLTYPREWSQDPRAWKRDLDAFGKAMRREYPGSSALWKLEPQKRGAPHYHLIIYGTEWVCMEWLAETWYRIVGGTQAEHRDAGTRIERARATHAAMAYAAKNYAAKIVELPPGWEHVGRFWGIIGRADWPRSAVEAVELDERQTYAYRRILRRWAQGKGVNVPSDGTCNIFTRAMEEWKNVLALVKGEPPVYFGAHVRRYIFG